MKLRVIKYTRLRCPDEGVVGNRGAAAGLGQGLPEADQGIGSNRKEVSSPLWSWGRKVIEDSCSKRVLLLRDTCTYPYVNIPM